MNYKSYLYKRVVCQTYSVANVTAENVYEYEYIYLIEWFDIYNPAEYFTSLERIYEKRVKCSARFDMSNHSIGFLLYDNFLRGFLKDFHEFGVVNSKSSLLRRGIL